MRRPLAKKTPLNRCMLFSVCSLLLLAGAGPGLAVEPGQKAPNFKLKRLEGAGNLGLSDYRGKVVMLDFWGHW